MYPTIDVIMPCYYSNEIITPALEKIVSQTVVDNMTLILVNDCSPNTDCNYQDIIEKYKDRIKIRYFETKENVGPGEARQLGLNNATSDFIWFQDDDDEIYDENSIESLLKLIDSSNVLCASGQVYFTFKSYKIESRTEEVRPGSLQGSLLNRKFLQDQNIRFEPLLSFKEEDGAFCALFLLKANDSSTYRYLHENVYIRKYFNDHIHVTARSDIVQSIIALLIQKTIILSYAVDYYGIISLQNNTNFIDAIGFIPNLFDRLIYWLKKNNQKISLKTYLNIEKYLNYFNSIFIQFNLFNLDIERISNVKNFFFTGNDFYGSFDINLIYNFSNDYQKILKEIKENYVEK